MSTTVDTLEPSVRENEEVLPVKLSTARRDQDCIISTLGYSRIAAIVRANFQSTRSAKPSVSAKRGEGDRK